MKKKIVHAEFFLAVTHRINPAPTRLALCAIVALTVFAQIARAQNYWDVNGATAGLGGTGNWDLVTANWNDATGTAAPYVWPNTATSDAVFTGTAGTVTLTVGGVQVRNMDFLTNGYVIGTNTSSPLTLAAGGSTVNVANVSDSATISVSLTGTGGLTKIGAGTLNIGSGTTVAPFDTSNNYSGTTTVNQGTLVLQKNGGATAAIAIPGALIIGDGVGGPNADVVREFFGNQIADSAAVMVNSSGRFDLNSNADTIGALTINSGNVTLGSGGALTVATLNMTGGTISGTGSATLLLNGNVTATSDAGGNAATITSQVNLNGATRTFTVNDGPAAVDMTISGAITGGTAGLTKAGAGVLSLTGSSTYTGATNINAGSLFVDGSIASANTFVNAGGLLGGIGTIGGNVTNGGVVSPGHSPGTLTINGSYTQTSAGTLRTEIGGLGPSQHDLLQMMGSAMLNGRLDILRINNFTPVNGDQVIILTAAAGVSGRFSTLTNNFPSAPAAIVIYDPNDVRVVFLTFATLPGLTSNQREVAEELDKVANKARAAQMITFLVNGPLSGLPQNFDLIAPEELASIYEIGFSQATVQSINLQRRMDDIRSGSTGFSANGFTSRGADYSGGKVSDGKNPAPAFTPSPENRWGVFVTGTGQFVDVGDKNTNARGYDITTGGFTLGVDYRVSPNFAIGLNGGYAHSDADLVNDGHVTVDGGKGGLYATYFNGGFYLDGAVGGGYNSYDTRRGALNGTTQGKSNGAELDSLIGAGYDWKYGNWTFGPTATFQFTRIDIDSFTENGSIAPLHFPHQREDSKRSTVGARISQEFKLGGVVIKPEMRAAWQHEHGDQSYPIDSQFASGAGSVFTVHGPEIGRDSALVSGGVALQWNERVSTYVYYDGQLGRDNYDSHSISGGMRVSF